MGCLDRRVQRESGLRRRLLTPDYAELRRRTQERDRSLREKVMSLEEAAALVPDGASVGVGGSTLSRTPMAMIWALIRANRKDLRCARSITSSEGELLLASGASPALCASTPRPAAPASRNGAILQWACAFAPARWACRSCRCARCWAR